MTNNTNKRIAKNTFYLYIRMSLTMIITLYTSRVVINILGETDFGIYNIIGGIVVLFSFLNNAMTNSSQRFISYALGSNDHKNLVKTFRMSMSAHISIAILILLLAETLGLWFVNNKLNLPSDRIYASNLVYQFSILSLLTKILRVPYSSTIIAYEKMSFYSYISVIENILSLLIVYLITSTSYDSLIFYSLLIFIVSLVCTIIFKIYCSNKFEICRFRLEWDKKTYFNLLNFSGWSMLGGIGNISASQGCNILLNIFNSISINAAYAIGNQVSGAINNFVSNFQLAFTPQIVKLHANNNSESLQKLVMKTSLFSYYLLLVISIPFLLKTEIILKLWLKIVPQFSVEFCQLMVIYFLIDAIQAPLWNTIFATGKIKNYQIGLFIITILNIPISYILLSNNLSPIYVLITRVLLNLITAIIRTLYIKHLTQFSPKRYLVEVVLKGAYISVISFLPSYFISLFFNETLLNTLFYCILTILLTTTTIYFWGINWEERKLLNTFIQNKIKALI